MTTKKPIHLTINTTLQDLRGKSININATTDIRLPDNYNEIYFQRDDDIIGLVLDNETLKELIAILSAMLDIRYEP